MPLQTKSIARTESSNWVLAILQLCSGRPNTRIKASRAYREVRQWLRPTDTPAHTQSFSDTNLPPTLSADFTSLAPCNWEMRTQKLRFHLLRRTQSPNVLPLKPGVGQKKAPHASSTAMDFFLELISTLPVYSLVFFTNLSRVFYVLAVANTGSFVGPQNKIGHPACRCRQLMQVPVVSARRI